MGFEPTAFGLEVQRAIHCATGTVRLKLGIQIIMYIIYIPILISSVRLCLGKKLYAVGKTRTCAPSGNLISNVLP